MQFQSGGIQNSAFQCKTVQNSAKQCILSVKKLTTVSEFEVKN